MQRKRQQSDEFAAMYLRLPRDIKTRLESRADADGVSQASVVVDILRDALVETDTQARVRQWLAKL